MQPLGSPVLLAAYHRRLRSSHDFRIHVDVLTLNEVMVGTAAFLDGAVNIASDGLVRRTCALTISDPDGALDFADASRWSGDAIWVDRLVRIRHVLSVPGFGEVTAVPFIGVPTALSRQGIEVQVQCADKGALASRGAQPYTAAKGAVATAAIQTMMSRTTGEFRFRIPASTRRLSKPYAAGITDEAAPLTVAAEIARVELGSQLIYSCDGFLTLRPLPSSVVLDLGTVTDPVQAAADFTTLVNWVRVTGGPTTKKEGGRTVTSTPVTTVQLAPPSPASSTRLARRGVPRLLPLVIEESGYTQTSQTEWRATRELSTLGKVDGDIGVSVVPVFHGDVDDLCSVVDESGVRREVRLSTASIPLGVGGDMSVGFQRKVASSRLARPGTTVYRKTTAATAAAPKKRRRRKARK